jgi:hypothetical protein
MIVVSLRNSSFAALLLLAASSFSLAACSDSTDTTASTSSSGAGGGDGGAGGGSGGSGGAGGCSDMPAVPAMTVKGMVQYAGPVGDADVVRVVAFKDGIPGAPSGFTSSMPKPAFPYAYEFTVMVPPEGSIDVGIVAYLDIGGNNPMGPDNAEDLLSMTSPLVKVTTCEGAAVADVTIPTP